MDEVALFTDISLNPKTGYGIGGYITVPASYLDISPQDIERSDIAQQLVLRRFEDASSTRLEVRTVVWALEDLLEHIKKPGKVKLRIYTDSQCVAGLLNRRAMLEADGFLTRKKHSPLKNADLYRRFYALHGELEFEIVKVAGHSPSGIHDTVHRIFSIVDREVRRALSHRGDGVLPG
jgi:ribonuclease HI